MLDSEREIEMHNLTSGFLKFARKWVTTGNILWKEGSYKSDFQQMFEASAETNNRGSFFFFFVLNLAENRVCPTF